MPKIKDIVHFRSDLFFEGAVQIGWFETDSDKSRRAATNFIFHGPDYHGVAQESTENSQYELIDTAGFTNSVIDAVNSESSQKTPLALSIAGWGAGKSHLGLTLANLLARQDRDVVDRVLANMESAAPTIANQVRNKISDQARPVLVIPINGMNNFDLAAELNRQILVQLRSQDIDTAPIEDLTPRFKIAATFVERNFDLRTQEFTDRCGEDATAETLIAKLREHEDDTYRQVNKIFEAANGYAIRAVGQEAPQQLLQAVCEHYCGVDGPFQSVFIVFDEFGRYLEFAVERPHIAGESALQQLFEGVQNNSAQCFLLCFIQYELKAYISRISFEKQDTVKRYIGRYNTAPKFYLSTNLETLLAHLIQKQDTRFLREYLFADMGQWQTLHASIQKWFAKEAYQPVWRDFDRFQKVILEGCWPLSPLAVWFLRRLASTGKELQQRSAISFIEEVLSKEINNDLATKKDAWTIPATRLCTPSLLEELLASEEYGLRGAGAHAFLAAEQRYKNDFSSIEREILLAVLIAAKIRLKVRRDEFNRALSLLSGLSPHLVEPTVDNLMTEYGVLEWNDRFQRYEIIGDAVPRTEFSKFLKKKTGLISTEQIEDFFALHMKRWAELGEQTPAFDSNNEIMSNEWRFQVECTHLRRLDVCIANAVKDWKNAIQVDAARGQLIYCYTTPDTDAENTRIQILKRLNHALKAEDCESGAPVLIVMLHDTEGKLKQILAEYWVINNELTQDEQQRYTNFIRDYNTQLAEELKLTQEAMVKQRHYIFPKMLKVEKGRLSKMALHLFEALYPDILPFPFDGFSTARGNAAKDCREITIELLKGSLNAEWIAERNPKTQNRAVSLLQRSWGALGEDGEIAWLPSNSKVRQVISLLDQRLKTEKALLVDDLMEMLILPPFGCNIASASLILGVFVGPRKDHIAFLFEGSEVQLAVWIKAVYTGNFVDRKSLKKTEICYVSESESDEWQDLLARWDLEPTHYGKVDFLEQAHVLNQRIKIPAGRLHEKFKRLESIARDSYQVLTSFEEFISQQEEYYFRAYQKEDVANLSRVGKDLSMYLKKMTDETDAWMPDQFKMIEPKIENAKQAVIHCFEPWLREQSILKPQQIGDFKHRMLDLVGGNLKTLELYDLNKEINKYVKKIIMNIEERQRAAYIVEEAEAFINGHRVDPTINLSALQNWLKTCDDLLKSLRKTKRRIDAPDIEHRIAEILDFKKACQKQIKAHKKRVEMLWEKQFCNLQDIRTTRGEVKELLTLFAGVKIDMEDIRTMYDQLGQFERDIALWQDINIPTDELKEMADQRIRELVALRSDDDPPPWDVEQVYPGLLKTILAERLKLAGEWVAAVLPADVSGIDAMSAETCHQLLQRLNSPPAFLEPAHIQKVSQIRAALEKRLNDLKVDGLLVRFRELTPTLRKQFLDIAQKLINESE